MQIRYLLNHGTFGLWVLSAREGIGNLVTNGEFYIDTLQSISFIIGILWGATRVWNGIADGRINRRKTALENEILAHEINENNAEDILDRHETDK